MTSIRRTAHKDKKQKEPQGDLFQVTKYILPLMNSRFARAMVYCIISFKNDLKRKKERNRNRTLIPPKIIKYASKQFCQVRKNQRPTK